MNPLALLGQIEGSISMGLGIALQENFVMKNGYVQTDSLYKCRLPTVDQTPEVIAFFVEDETKDGPYGAKGVGELHLSQPHQRLLTIYNAVASALVRPSRPEDTPERDENRDSK
jgi:xanthine dehydrogenase molybdenum-binding subunit